MNVSIEVIPHDKQRYPTCGDWQFDPDGNLKIRVSKLTDWRHEACLMVHELIEALECEHVGVTEQSVDEFDIEYEKKHANDITLSTAEPGDHPDAPYRQQHFHATTHERIFADALGVDWLEYEKELNSL